MNEFKGTPGPWRFHFELGQKYTPTLREGCGDHYEADYWAVVNACGDVVCDNAQYYPQAVTLEDARLIAAAPDLLWALIETRRVLELANFTQELAYVKAAIAKALGEQ